MKQTKTKIIMNGILATSIFVGSTTNLFASKNDETLSKSEIEKIAFSVPDFDLMNQKEKKKYLDAKEQYEKDNNVKINSNSLTDSEKLALSTPDFDLMNQKEKERYLDAKNKFENENKIKVNGHNHLSEKEKLAFSVPDFDLMNQAEKEEYLKSKK
jgi:predicted DNA binding protein